MDDSILDHCCNECANYISENIAKGHCEKLDKIVTPDDVCMEFEKLVYIISEDL